MVESYPIDGAALKALLCAGITSIRDSVAEGGDER